MEAILKFTGIAGLSLTILYLLFKNIIVKNIFPQLSQEQGYKILRLIIILVFSISVISLIIYFFLNTSPQEENLDKPQVTSSPATDPLIINKAIAVISSYLNTPDSNPEYYTYLATLDKEILPNLMSAKKLNIRLKVDSISKTLKIYSYILNVEDKISKPDKKYLENKEILSYGVIWSDGILKIDSKYLIETNNFDFKGFVDSIVNTKNYINEYTKYLNDLPDLNFSYCSNSIAKEDLIETMEYLVAFEDNKAQSVNLINYYINQSASPTIEWDDTSNGSKKIKGYIFLSEPTITFDFKNRIEKLNTSKEQYKNCLYNNLADLRSTMSE